MPQSKVVSDTDNGGEKGESTQDPGPRGSDRRPPSNICRAWDAPEISPWLHGSTVLPDAETLQRPPRFLVYPLLFSLSRSLSIPGVTRPLGEAETVSLLV